MEKKTSIFSDIESGKMQKNEKRKKNLFNVLFSVFRGLIMLPSAIVFLIICFFDLIAWLFRKKGFLNWFANIGLINQHKIDIYLFISRLIVFFSLCLIIPALFVAKNSILCLCVTIYAVFYCGFLGLKIDKLKK